MFSLLQFADRQSPLRTQLLSLILLMSYFWIPSVASAQAPWDWYPALNPDYSMAGGKAGQVSNTGCAQVGLAGNTLRVMCWDRIGNNTPCGLSWSFSPDETPGNQGTTIFGKIPLDQKTDKVAVATSMIIDPDVVADPTHNATTNTRVLVTYSHVGRLANGGSGVFYEIFEYDSRQNMMVSIGNPISLSTTGINSNVDVDTNGNAVITWAESGKIYAMVYNFSTQTAHPKCLIAEDSGYILSLPDVAVFNQRREVTSFIYLATDASGNQTVRMNQVSRPQLESQTSVSNGVGTDIYPNGTGSYTAPRIAAPIDWTGVGEFDFQAVVYDRSTNGIIMLSNYGQQYSVDTTGPPASGILNAGVHMDKIVRCSSPVVSFSGDAVIACWIMEDNPNNPMRNGTKEVLQTSMSWL